MAAEASSLTDSLGLSDDDIVFDIPNYLRIHKDGRVDRLRGTETVPPGTDPSTRVRSKDVVISLGNNVQARLYIPKATSTSQAEKLPILVYFHGGGFCIMSAKYPPYHNYLNLLVSEAKVVAVSVDYRSAPEHRLPSAYDDSWAAAKWVASHATKEGPEPWLNEFADFNRLFFAGDSAGGNIVHQMSVRAGTESECIMGLNLNGVILDDPFFWGAERIGNESKVSKAVLELIEKLCIIAIPDLKTLDHPWMNPAIYLEDLRKIGCERVLVCVADEDALKDRGEAYYHALRRSGWSGKVELFQSDGVGHVFHVDDPTCKQAVELMKKFVEFINDSSV